MRRRSKVIPVFQSSPFQSSVWRLPNGDATRLTNSPGWDKTRLGIGYMEGGAGNCNCLWKHCWSTNTTFMTFNAAKPNTLWTKGEVPGTCYSVSSREWVDEELFLGWLVECFLQHSVSSRPLPLPCDGQISLRARNNQNSKRRKHHHILPAPTHYPQVTAT